MGCTLRVWAAPQFTRVREIVRCGAGASVIWIAYASRCLRSSGVRVGGLLAARGRARPCACSLTYVWPVLVLLLLLLGLMREGGGGCSTGGVTGAAWSPATTAAARGGESVVYAPEEAVLVADKSSSARVEVVNASLEARGDASGRDTLAFVCAPGDNGSTWRVRLDSGACCQRWWGGR